MADRQTTLVTGVPRSGSTLLIKTIAENSVDTLVLDEPGWLKKIRQTSEPHATADALNDHLAVLRNQVSRQKPIELTYGLDGQEIADNHFKRTAEGIQRTKTAELITPEPHWSEIHWFIKSNIYFTAVLDQLLESCYFQIIATVRNPVAVLKSWRSLDVSVSKGRSLMAEKFDPQLAHLGGVSDRLHRQVLLLDWMYKKYLNKSGVDVVKYESFVEQPNILNSMIEGCHIPAELKFSSQNNSDHYDHSETEAIIGCLEKYGQYYKYFYPEPAVI